MFTVLVIIAAIGIGDAIKREPSPTTEMKQEKTVNENKGE